MLLPIAGGLVIVSFIAGMIAMTLIRPPLANMAAELNASRADLNMARDKVEVERRARIAIETDLAEQKRQRSFAQNGVLSSAAQIATLNQEIGVLRRDLEQCITDRDASRRSAYALNRALIAATGDFYAGVLATIYPHVSPSAAREAWTEELSRQKGKWTTEQEESNAAGPLFYKRLKAMEELLK